MQRPDESRCRRRASSTQCRTADPRAARGGEEWLEKQPAYHAQHVEQRVEEDMRVSTWMGEQFVENEGSREATLESHGMPWRAAHGVP